MDDKVIEKVIMQVSQINDRMTKMEVTVYGNNGKGGLYDMVTSFIGKWEERENRHEEQFEKRDKEITEIKKMLWKIAGGLLVSQIVILPIIFKFLIN